jgi:tetraacyldisaccharide 4'-kinase
VVFTQRGPAVQPAVEVRRPFHLSARLSLGDALNVRTGARRALDTFRGNTLAAVAGIGHPQAFFAGLRAAGLQFAAHPLADHAALDPTRLPFPAEATVLMTEKDAVKCRSFAGVDWWFVELGVQLERTAANDWLTQVLERAG